MNQKISYFLGIDNGGSMTKAAIFDSQGHEIAAASRHLPMDRPYPGWTQRDGRMIWKTNCQVIKEAITRSGLAPEAIAAVSVCGYGGGLALLNQKKEPVSPFIVSTDTRAQPLLEKLKETGRDALIYKKTHQDLWAGQCALLLPWLRQNQPELLNRAAHAVLIKDYVRLCLTGQLATDWTDASNSGLFNLYTKAYDPDIFSLLGIEDCFSLVNTKVLGPSDLAGRITPEVARQCGLSPETPVAAGLYDVDACCLASGVTKPGTLCLVTGTWSINGYLISQPTDCPGAGGVTLSFLSDLYMAEESSPTSAGNLDWFIDCFLTFPETLKTRKDQYAFCNREAASVSPFEEIPIFLPYLYASNSVPGARGCFLELSSSHKGKHMVRAVYEGILFSTCWHIEKLTGSFLPSGPVRLSGGIANSPFWVQMLADILQVPVELTKGTEKGALGAAMCAAVLSGQFSSFPDAVSAMCHLEQRILPDQSLGKIYEDKYRRFKKAIDSLTVFYK